MKTVLNVATFSLKDLSSSKRIISVTNIFIAGNKMDIQMAVKAVDAASEDYDCNPSHWAELPVL